MLMGVPVLAGAALLPGFSVRATAQDAFANGFDVVVPRPATDTNRTHLGEASFEDIDRYIGRVTDMDGAKEALGA